MSELSPGGRVRRVAARPLSDELAGCAATHKQLVAERPGRPVSSSQLQLAGAAGRASEATGARPRLVAATDPSDS